MNSIGFISTVELYGHRTSWGVIMTTDRHDEKTTELLTQLWKPHLHPNISMWQYSATKPEKKGLKLIAAILKHKGTKRFRTRASTTALPALAEIRKPTFQTAYAAEFSSIPISARSHAAIFQYRKLADLPCSQVLNPIPLRILEAWFALHDDTEYQELVLGTLRSFLASAETTHPAMTEFKAQYIPYDYSNLYSSHNMGSSARLVKDTRLSKPWVRPEKPPVYEPIEPHPVSLDDVKKRKEMLMRGSGDVGRLYLQSTEPVLSSYQQTFVTHFTNYKSRVKPDFYTSVSTGRLCPDRKEYIDEKKVEANWGSFKSREY